MKFINLILLCILVFSCGHDNVAEHKGEKNIIRAFSDMDTIPLMADSVSWEGNFFSHGDNLCFADRYYTSVLLFDWESGMLKQRMIRRGHSKKELHSFLYAYHLGGTDDCIIFVDASNFMYIYNTATSSFEYKGAVDMGRTSVKKGDYEDPSVYNIMEIAECGVDFYKTGVGKVLIPLSLVNRNLKDVDMSRYKDGHIWGEYDYKNGSFISLSGKYPECYRESPAPNFENFRYVKVKDDYFVSHTADSLVYVYNDDKNVRCCFGFEVSGADRSYTGKHFESGMDYLGDDMKRVTVNAGLVYSSDMNAMLRVSWNKVLSENERTTSVQLYDCSSFDLIAERTFGGLLQFLYTKGNTFYGVNVISADEREDKFNIYKVNVN